jgi:hypothetical protein
MPTEALMYDPDAFDEADRERLAEQGKEREAVLQGLHALYEHLVDHPEQSDGAFIGLGRTVYGTGDRERGMAREFIASVGPCIATSHSADDFITLEAIKFLPVSVRMSFQREALTYEAEVEARGTMKVRQWAEDLAALADIEVPG